MIELTNSVSQVVATGQSVKFDTTAVKSGCAERHREGSALTDLIQPGRYLVTFSGNIAVPATGGTVGEVSLGLSVQGEILNGSLMRATPAAVSEYFNVSTQHYVDVPRTCNGTGCCQTVTVLNQGTPVEVDNPNLTAVRVCG